MILTNKIYRYFRCTHIHIHKCMHICTCAYKHTHIHACIHTHTYTYILPHAKSCIYSHTYMKKCNQPTILTSVISPTGATSTRNGDEATGSLPYVTSTLNFPTESVT